MLNHRMWMIYLLEYPQPKLEKGDRPWDGDPETSTAQKPVRGRKARNDSELAKLFNRIAEP
ncbi:MAG: hypothetical protein ACRC8Y_20055 [Chroococcales cyanobacterium]